MTLATPDLRVWLDNHTRVYVDLALTSGSC